MSMTLAMKKRHPRKPQAHIDHLSESELSEAFPRSAKSASQKKTPSWGRPSPDWSGCGSSRWVAPRLGRAFNPFKAGAGVRGPSAGHTRSFKTAFLGMTGSGIASIPQSKKNLSKQFHPTLSPFSSYFCKSLRLLDLWEGVFPPREKNRDRGV